MKQLLQLLAFTALLTFADTLPAAAPAPAKPRGKRAAKAETFALYNLATDLGERTDLAAEEPARVAAMRAKLEELLKDAVPPGQLNHEPPAPAPAVTKPK